MMLKFVFIVCYCCGFYALPAYSCQLQRNSPTAAATHPPVRREYPTYSCTPCHKGQYEVHVINIYEPTGSYRGFQQEPTHVKYVPIEIKSEKQIDMKLVLINYEAAHWVITKPSNVNILAVNVLSYYHRYTTASLSDNSMLAVEEDREYYSGWREINKVENYVTNKYGYMTSFTGVYHSSSFKLTVGTCDTSTTITTRTIATTEYPSACLGSDSCWLKYRFRYDNSWNRCHGDQYVTMYKQQFYVGVILCSARRYKIFMSDSLTGKYLNIGDGEGHGTDHCEFVGAVTETTAKCDSNFWVCPSTTGFYRYRWGQDITKGKIGGSPDWTGKYYGKWCQCGVSIPGNKTVITYVNTATSATKITTSFYWPTRITTRSTTAITPISSWTNSGIEYGSDTTVNIMQIIGVVIGLLILVAVITVIIVIVICIVQRQRRAVPGTVIHSNVNWNQQTPHANVVQPGQLPNQYVNRQPLQPPQQASILPQQVDGPPPTYDEALRYTQVNGGVRYSKTVPAYTALSTGDSVFEDASSSNAERGV